MCAAPRNVSRSKNAFFFNPGSAAIKLSTFVPPIESTSGRIQAVAWIDSEAEAKSVVNVIEALGRKARAIRCDVTRESDVSACVNATLSGLGRLDILVSNAGIQRPQAITEMTVEDWDRMMAVHLRGAFLVSREAAKHMIPRKSGWMIFTC